MFRISLQHLMKVAFPRYVIIPTCKMSENTGPVATSIKKKLSTHLEPTHLDIIDESHMHNVPVGSETHFKVVVISDKFADMTLLKRHRLINNILKHELDNGVHALSITAKTNAQWGSGSQKVEPSPACRGGFGK